MQNQRDLLRSQWNNTHGLPDCGDHLAGIQLDFAPNQLAGDGDRQIDQLFFDFVIECLKRFAQGFQNIDQFGGLCTQ